MGLIGLVHASSFHAVEGFRYRSICEAYYFQRDRSFAALRMTNVEDDKRGEDDWVRGDEQRGED